MGACEKCWDDAGIRQLSQQQLSKVDIYRVLLDERKDNPCQPWEQKGITEAEFRAEQQGEEGLS